MQFFYVLSVSYFSIGCSFVSVVSFEPFNKQLHICNLQLRAGLILINGPLGIKRSFSFANGPSDGKKRLLSEAGAKIKYYSKSPDIFFSGFTENGFRKSSISEQKIIISMETKILNRSLFFYFSHATDSFRRRRDEIKIINYLTF